MQSDPWDLFQDDKKPGVVGPEKSSQDYEIKYGAKVPTEDGRPWVIIIKSMTSKQAMELGPVLGNLGITGTFRSGHVADLLVKQLENEQATIKQQQDMPKWQRRKDKIWKRS